MRFHSVCDLFKARIKVVVRKAAKLENIPNDIRMLLDYEDDTRDNLFRHRVRSMCVQTRKEIERHIDLVSERRLYRHHDKQTDL